MEIKAITKLGSVECLGCQRGQALCQNPCWATPNDIQKLIIQGMGSSLMLNVFFLQDFELVQALGPALQEYEGRYFFGYQSALSVTGCTFQDSDSKLCSIHKSKPIEGKIACCKRFTGVHGEHETRQIRYSIGYRWTELSGEKLVRNWKRDYLKDCPLDDDQLRQEAANLIAQKLIKLTYI
jgi:Fe-S-cluster containining protein